MQHALDKGEEEESLSNSNTSSPSKTPVLNSINAMQCESKQQRVAPVLVDIDNIPHILFTLRIPTMSPDNTCETLITHVPFIRNHLQEYPGVPPLFKSPFPSGFETLRIRADHSRLARQPQQQQQQQSTPRRSFMKRSIIPKTVDHATFYEGLVLSVWVRFSEHNFCRIYSSPCRNSAASDSSLDVLKFDHQVTVYTNERAIPPNALSAATEEANDYFGLALIVLNRDFIRFIEPDITRILQAYNEAQLQQRQQQQEPRGVKRTPPAHLSEYDTHPKKRQNTKTSVDA